MAGLFQTVLTMSLGAGLLALLILGARSLLGRRPGPFLPVLYALLMLRLALPLFVPSPLSLQNLLYVPETPISTVNVPFEEPVTTEDETTIIPEYDLTPPVSQQNNAETANAATDIPESTTFESTPIPLSPLEIAAIVWLAGVAFAATVFIVGNIRFTWMLKRNRVYDETGFMALLDECKQQLGLKRHIPVIQAQGVSAAAVYGVFRPKLLISPDFLWLNPSQRRHVLLHELSHIRRRDTEMCLFATVLCIVHWFNPLIWLAFGLMRRDIELFCDDNTVKALGDDERQSYAATLLALVSPQKPPHLVTAMFISHTYIKKRILTIARRKKVSALYTALALLLTTVIAITGCTAAVADTLPAEATEPPAAVSPVPTSVPAQATTVREEAPTSGISTSSSNVIAPLLIEFPYSISEVGMEFDDVVANIDKAVGLLNGITVPAGGSVSVTERLGELTESSGWLNASTTGWMRMQHFRTDPSNHDRKPALDIETRDTQIGGGIEFAAMALCRASASAGLNVRLLQGGQILSGGDLTITNPLKGDIQVTMSRTDNIITVSVFGAAQDGESADQSSALTASYLLDITGHDSDVAVDNVQKAVDFLNGRTIAPGETLSLNAVLGPLTMDNGWKKAAEFQDGAYVGSPGGGVCMVATALYNAAIRAEMEIIEVRQHSAMPIDYVDGGLDADISTGGPDLKIRNTYNTAVTLAVYLEDNNIVVEVWGPQLDHDVNFFSKKISATAAPERVYHYNATMTPAGQAIPPGAKIPYLMSCPGAVFRVYKTVSGPGGVNIGVDGQQLSKVTLFSEVTYRAIEGEVYVNGPDPDAG